MSDHEHADNETLLFFFMRRQPRGERLVETFDVARSLHRRKLAHGCEFCYFDNPDSENDKINIFGLGFDIQQNTERKYHMLYRNMQIHKVSN